MISDLADARPAARLRSVLKCFGEGATTVRALDGVDFEIRYGEMMLLVGPSGCGKSTLLSVLTGILDPTQGEVEVLGARLDQMSQSQKTEFRRQNLGFIFQQYHLLPTLTATENVAVPLLIHRVPYPKALERAEAYLEKVGMSDRANFLPAKLSGGQQQRVAIARALVTEPALIVCDEPTAALDGHTGVMVLDMFRAAALNPNRAIIIVTHDSRIFHYGDRIADMRDGRIVSIRQGQKLETGVTP